MAAIAEPKTEMAFPRAVVEAKVRGKEETVSEHLVKLLAFDASEETRRVWKKELRTHFAFLSRMRLRPHNRSLPADDFYEWLYREPYEGNEANYVQGLIELFEEDFPRNGRSAAQVAELIKWFHQDMSGCLHRGDAGRELIEAL